jgi:hypothetical protein
VHLKRNDAWATIFVLSALALFILWWTGTAFESLSTRIVGAGVFGLGFLACTSTQEEMPDVFGVGTERRVSAAYVVIASLLGLTALVASIITLIGGSEAMLAVLVVTMSVLWAISTIRHALRPDTRLRRDQRTETAGPFPRPA